MKNLQKMVSTFTLAAALTLGLNACNQQFPLQSNLVHETSLAKGKPSKQRSDSTQLFENNYSTFGPTVESGTMTARYNKKCDTYQGGKIILSQGSQFELQYGSLTPPSELHGQDVTISMTVTMDEANNQMQFEFGPHGSQFSPAATVWLHYTGSNPKLYYIDDNGDYVEQQPDEVDSQNQWLMLKINHFSRYAVAWSD